MIASRFWTYKLGNSTMDTTMQDSDILCKEPSTGKLESQEKCTTPTSPSISKVTFDHLVRPDLGNFRFAANLAQNEKIKTLMKNGEKVYHFAFGQTPFPVMDGMVRALRDNAGQNAYLPVAGIPELREAIVAFHQRYDHLQGLHADQILVGPGSKELISLLLDVFNGDVMIITPCWTSYKPQATLAHQKIAIIETSMEGGWKITPHMVEQTIQTSQLSGANKLLIMCNPDNPTGIAYSGNELAALSDVFRKHKIIVLADEIYARLHYTQSHDTLARYYPEGTILSTGFSKWASAGGWRLGYHIYPPELKALRNAVRCAASHTFTCAPAPMQYAAAKALNNEEETDNFIKHCTRILAAVSKYCVGELKSIGVKAIPSEAGFYVMFNFDTVKPAVAKRGITTGDQLCQVIFEEAKVALSDGPTFFRHPDEFIGRISFVNFDGKPALDESRRIGLETQLTADFVKKYATPAYEGIQVLKAWIEKQLQQE